MIGRSFLLAGLVLCLVMPVRAQDNPRITETTRLVQKCLPAVVSLPMVTPGEKPP